MKKIIPILVCMVLTATLALAGIGSLAVTTTESQVYPYDPNRNWVWLQNNDTNSVYLKFSVDTNALTTTNGILIPAGGQVTLSRTGQNVAQNRATAITSTNTANLTYQYGSE